MSQRTYPQPAKQAASRAFCLFNTATFTVGTKSVNTINVAVALKDARGQSLPAAAVAKCYLASSATGIAALGTATTSAIAIGTNGLLIDIITTGIVFEVASTAAGLFDVNLIQSVSPTTVYLVVVMPDGSIAVSPAITW